MPSTMKIRVISARDLPVMDRKSLLADPFVTIRLGEFKKATTTIARKTLNPVWNELFRFEIVNDLTLQDEPLEITVYDKDTYTADDVCGKVLIDLNCLLIGHSGSGAGCDSISGYFPLFDSFHGIRGHLHVSIKLNFFHDNNPFKDSSAGVQFFSVSTLEGYVIEAIHGFVEELILDKDPEYHWVDSFRASRTSNEARLKLFNTLAAKVTRNVGRKALELGGNAVLAFKQTFDLEGEIGIVARASGTAVTIRRIGAGSINSTSNSSTSTINHSHPNSSAHHHHHQASLSHLPSTSNDTTLLKLDTAPSTVVEEPPTTLSNEMKRQEEEEEETKEVVVIDTHDQEERKDAAQAAQVLDPSIISSTLEHAQQALHPSSTALLPTVETRPGLSRHEYRREVHLLTLTSFPSTVQICLGGIVSARAVKVLDASRSGGSQRAHDRWWQALRKEIQNHARALNCTTVIGYTEQTTMHDHVIVLSACGTAARVGWFRPVRQLNPSSSPPRHHHQTTHGHAASSQSQSHRSSQPNSTSTTSVSNAATNSSQHRHGASAPPVSSSARSRTRAEYSGTGASVAHFSALKHHRRRQAACASVHVPYARDSTGAFRMSLRPCGMCGKKFVPELLLTSVELYAFNNSTPVAIGLSTHPARDQFPERDLFRVPIIGKGCLIEARVCRAKKRTTSHEQSAQAVSESLPFLEYELHRQLVYKLRVMGLNAAFGLRMQLVIGENLIVGISTATAVFIPALPAPPVLLIKRYIGIEDQEDRTLVDLQQKLMQLSQSNRAYWQAMLKIWKKEQKQKQKRMKRQYRQHQYQLQQQQLQFQKSLGGTPPLPGHTGGGGSPFHRALRSPAIQPHHHHHHASSSLSHSSHHAHAASGSASVTHSSRHLRAPLPPRALQLGGATPPPSSDLLISRQSSTEDARSTTHEEANRDPTSVSTSAATMDRQVSESATTSEPYESTHQQDEANNNALNRLTAATMASASPRPNPASTSHRAMSDVSEESHPSTMKSETGSAGGDLPTPAPITHLSTAPQPPDTHSHDLSHHHPLKHASTAPQLLLDPPASSPSESESSSSSEDSSEDESIQSFADTRSEFILQIDDEADEDLMSVLLEPTAPDHVFMCNTECLPGLQPQKITLNLDSHHHPRASQGSYEDVFKSPAAPLSLVAPGSPNRRPVMGGPGTPGKPSPSHESHSLSHHHHGSQVPSPHSSHTLQTSLPNVQMLTLVRRVEWKDDVASMEDTVKKKEKQQQQAASSKNAAGAAGGSKKLSKEAQAQLAKENELNLLAMGGKVEAKLTGLNRLLSSIYHDLYAAMCFKVQSFAHPCYLAGIRSCVSLPSENTVEVVMLALAVRQTIPPSLESQFHRFPTTSTAMTDRLRARDRRRRKSDEKATRRGGIGGEKSISSSSSSSTTSSSSSSSEDEAAPPTSGTPMAIRAASVETRTRGLFAKSDEEEKRADERGLSTDSPLSGEMLKKKAEQRLRLIQQTNKNNSRSRYSTQSTVSMLHTPLPPSLLTSIDPATHKAYGMPLFLPPLTLGAMQAFRTKVIRQLVDMNTLSGREANSISGLKDTPVLPVIDSLALTPAAGMSSKHLGGGDRGLNEFLLEHNAASASLNQVLPNPALPLTTPNVPTHRTLSGNNLSSMADATPSAPASALSILAAASVPIISSVTGPSTTRHLDEQKEKMHADGTDDDLVIVGQDEEATVTTNASSSIRPSSTSHLSIHLPAAPGSTAPSPSPHSTNMTGATTTQDEQQPPQMQSPQPSFSSILSSHELFQQQFNQAVAAQPILPSNELLGVEFTPLSFIPHAHITHYLGRVCIHLIKEIYSYDSKGGLGTFIEQFLLEINQLGRAHVLSRGGNTMIGYQLQQFCYVTDNNAYAIISISGDAVKVQKQSTKTTTGASTTAGGVRSPASIPLTTTNPVSAMYQSNE